MRLSGQLKVRNFENRPVEVIVNAMVRGKPLSASEAGTISTNAEKLVLTEREGRVLWKITIEPGAIKTLEYKYERYVASP